MDGTNLWAAVSARADEDPLLVEGTSAWTVTELRREVRALCRAFAERGLSEGGRIALLSRNDARFVHLLVACARAGLVLVPINARLSPAEASDILKDADAALLFHDSDWAAAPCVATHGAAINLDADWDALISSADASPASAPVQSGAEAPLLQLYTSGTTGRPKGAVLSHRAMQAIFRNGAIHLGGVDAEAEVLVCLPLFHIAAILWVGVALCAGARLQIAPGPDADTVRDAVARGVTHTMLVPAAVRSLLDELDHDDTHLTGLRALVFGAAPMPEALIARAEIRLPGTALIHAYGLTETAGMFTVLPPEELAERRRMASCGRPFPDGEIDIRDTDGASVPAGSTGEVWHRGPQVMTGYWRNPQATGAALVDGWLRTGDAGALDADGFLTLHDRLKDVVITGGENVYPAEVESVYSHHPDVHEMAVIGLPDDRWGETVTAVVVLREPGATIDIAALRDWGRDRLAGFKLPRRVHVVPLLPRNGAGKVQKHILRAGLTSATSTEGTP